MRKFCLFFVLLSLCTGVSGAAVRIQNTQQRGDIENNSGRQNAISRSAVTTPRPTTSRQSKKTTKISDSTSRKTTSRTNATKIISVRPTNTTRSATRTSMSSQRNISRAATTVTKTTAFDENYYSCRDAYFTCMDQFCANQNETYRRCVCSSQLSNIQAKEKLLSQTANSLQDFQDLNIDSISKTSGEVKAMLSASAGESAITQDTSNSSKTLNNISDILKKTKQKSLSTAGQLDIAGDIKSIWTTTDFIGGSNIANLTGEALYNAVHAQCAELVTQNCPSDDLKMITSAYGMYIENDCAILADNINSKITTANAAIRATRHEMQDARLENYDTHNSLTVNDCIARVRQDMTASTACGDGYIHCLDFTGKYLNMTTGEPIYSPDFYQLGEQISLSGDILKNSENTKTINALNQKRMFAQNSLDLCTDNADEVWDEFLRQALVEIYQGQQQRIQNVKTECLQVVNDCYLQKSDTLKKFSDSSSSILLGHTLELSEEMCAEKLNTCSNLYGGGPEGLALLVNTLSEITNETIAQTCPDLLTTFAENICAVPSNDSYHSYPYGCRVYAPGESRYAHEAICNTTFVNPFSKSDVILSEGTDLANEDYVCPNGVIRYLQCNFNYYLYRAGLSASEVTKCHNDPNTFEYYEASKYFCKKYATECHICPPGYICVGGMKAPQNINTDLYNSCGIYYIGSLYQQLVVYALQNCTRPSQDISVLPESLLADVNAVMQRIQIALVSELSKECGKYDGTWVDIPWQDDDYNGYHDITGDTLLKEFYDNTGTNKLWGYCK